MIHKYRTFSNLLFFIFGLITIYCAEKYPDFPEIRLLTKGIPIITAFFEIQHNKNKKGFYFNGALHRFLRELYFIKIKKTFLIRKKNNSAPGGPTVVQVRVKKLLFFYKILENILKFCIGFL